MMKEYINYIKAIHRYHKEGVSYKNVFYYLMQWKKYVVSQSPNITIRPFTFKQFYNIIQHYKKQYEVPNIIFVDENITIGKIYHQKDIKGLPFKNRWLKIYKEKSKRENTSFYVIKDEKSYIYLLMINKPSKSWSYYNVNGNTCIPSIEIPDKAYNRMKDANIISVDIFNEMLKQYFERRTK